MIFVRHVSKYGRMVWSHVLMDWLRRRFCLCLNCHWLEKSKADPRCPAGALYVICKDRDLALAVTRCPCFAEAERDRRG